MHACSLYSILGAHGAELKKKKVVVGERWKSEEKERRGGGEGGGGGGGEAKRKVQISLPLNCSLMH